MEQVNFSWWPWRTLALGIPLLALVCALLAEHENHSHTDVLVTFFGVLAAANGYLFAMAVGDFGRSVFAIPIGAFSGYCAIHLFSLPIANVIYFVFLFIVIANSISGRMMNALPGCLVMFFIVVSFLAAVTRVSSAGTRPAENPEAAVISAYPFVCSCIAAIMPVENSVAGVFQAAIAGTRAALYGFAAGGSIALLAMFFGAVIMTNTGGMIAKFVSIAVIGLSVSLINYFCIRNIFTAMHRVEAPRVKTADESDSERYLAELENESSDQRSLRG